MLWYVVVVFFAAGLSNPAHFEDQWYPRVINGDINECLVAGNNVLNYLGTHEANLKGEIYEVACIGASDMKELSDIIRKTWSFEPAPGFDTDPFVRKLSI